MNKLKKIHRDADQLNFKEIWATGVFIFDSNVLLDLYRLPKSAREDLINIFTHDKFNSRIWIGFQVLLEFLNNRHEAISDQKNKFHSVRILIDDTIQKYEEVINSLNTELEKLKLKQRHSLIDPDMFINRKNTEKGSKFLYEFIDNLNKLEQKQLDVHEADSLKDLVLDIFNGKVGEGFDIKKLIEIYTDGEKRYERKIPPGYKDIKKDGAHLYEDKEYIRKYGDLILWNEIIEKAKSESLKYIVLVTGDVKEDWWNEKRGKKLGPRVELLNEIYHKADKLDTFYMYDTSTFLQHAKMELAINVKDSSIDEAKQLIEYSRQTRQQNEDGQIFLIDIIKQIARPLRLTVGMGSSVKSLPLLNVNTAALHSAIVEIFSNVINHSEDRYVSIHTKLNDNILTIRFKNNKKKEYYGISLNNEGRGKGIDYIRTLLSKNGIDTHISEDEKTFWVEIFIPLIPNTFTETIIT